MKNTLKMKRIFLTVVFILACLIGKSQYDKGIVIEPMLKTDTTVLGQKIIYPRFNDNEVNILKITIPPGKSTGWHKHEIPVFAVILEGILTVETEGYGMKQYSSNESFAETINIYHNGSNNGSGDVILIAFYMGEKGKFLSVPKQ